MAASSVSYDLHQKLGAFRRNGVQEYLVHRVDDGEVDWFVLENGNYVRQQPDEDGVVKSRVFPGLWLDVPALLRGDRRAVRTTIERGTADPVVDTGHEDDGWVGMIAPQMAQQMQPVLLTQAQIDNDDIMGAGGKFTDRLIKVLGRIGLPTQHLDTSGEDQALDRLIIDNEDTKRHGLCAEQVNHVFTP